MDWLFFYVIPFLLIFTLIVFVHELGHYLAARKNGIGVEIFSIGMGPELFGFTDKNKTRWRFSAIPFGGYIWESDETGKSPWSRMFVRINGPLFNYLLAIFVFFLVYSVAGRPQLLPIIKETVPNTPAQIIGLQPNDKILQINDRTIETYQDLQRIIQTTTGEVQLKIERAGENISYSITPQERKSLMGKSTRILGIIPSEPKYIQQSIGQAIYNAFSDSINLSIEMSRVLWGLITGSQPLGTLGGPIKIAEISGNISKTGDIKRIMIFIATLSVNLGFINLLPLPALDGGNALLCIIEGVIRKPLGAKAQDIFAYIGFAIIALLTLFSFGSDIFHLNIVQNFLSGFK